MHTPTIMHPVPFHPVAAWPPNYQKSVRGTPDALGRVHMTAVLNINRHVHVSKVEIV